MECQHLENNNIFTTAQETLPSITESIILPSGGYSTELINIDGIRIIPQDEHLDGTISDGANSNQKSFKLSEAEFIEELDSVQEIPLRKNNKINHLCSSDAQSKLLDIMPIHEQVKSSDIAMTKFCSDITAQKLTIMQGMIKKECNNRPGNENLSGNYITAIEQPNIGICSCFICGIILPDPNERCMYLDHQRLLGVKLTLLQFLSEILYQKILTNTPEIYLCQKCSDLINEADNISKQLNKIKYEIEKYFNANDRPKLTYQVVQHLSNIMSHANREIDTSAEKAEISLRELALTRPRHRNKTKHIDKTRKDGTNYVKKKALGRPRKPFQCTVCKLKFITNTLLHRHCFREHSPQIERCPNGASICSKNPAKSHSAKGEVIATSVDIIKLEKQGNQKSDNTKLPIISEIPFLHRFPEQRSVSLPPMPVRPIQPKPQTLYQLNNDGSVVFLMGPVANETNAALVTVTPSYINLNRNFYSCDLCIKKFVDEKSYKMHRIAAHGIRKRKTIEGKIDADTDNKLKEVLSSVFECPVCESVFGSQNLLYQHINIVHFCENSSLLQQKCKLYKCEHCSRIFTFKYEMERHKEDHLPYNKIGPHEFVCSVCELRLASKAALKIHLHRFHKDESIDEKEYLCAICGYMTRTKRAFSDHARIHNSNVSTIKMQCQLCKKEMLSSSFKIHMTRMHGEAKFSCKLCDKKFTVRSDLMRHNNVIHSNLRPYHCTECEKKFITSEALRYHRKKLHSNISHYCEVCGNCYKLKGELQRHINHCHKEIKSSYGCSLCTRNYVDRRKLKLHMAVKHKVYKDICSEKNNPNILSSCEYNNKEKALTADKDGLSLKNCESQVLLSSDPEMFSPNSQLEHSIEAVPSSALCNIKIYQDVQEESIVLSSLNPSDTFQSETTLHSPFSTENVSHMETVFTDAKHCNQEIESNFTEHLQNVDPVYVVRHYEEAS